MRPTLCMVGKLAEITEGEEPGDFEVPWMTQPFCLIASADRLTCITVIFRSANLAWRWGHRTSAVNIVGENNTAIVSFRRTHQMH